MSIGFTVPIQHFLCSMLVSYVSIYTSPGLNESMSIGFMLPIQHFLCSMIVSSYVSISHWGRVMHICVSKLTIIGSDNGLSPGRRQAIIWTNDGILLIRTFRTHFSEIVSEIHIFSFKKMYFKMSSGKWQPSDSASITQPHWVNVHWFHPTNPALSMQHVSVLC